MVLKAGIADPALLGIPESLLPDLREQAELFSREDLLRLFDAFQKIETGMKYATQVRFQLEMGLIELAHMSKLRSLEDLIADFASMSEGTREQTNESKTLPAGSAAASSPERPAPAGLKANPPSVLPPRKAATPDIPGAGSVEASVRDSGGTAPVRDPREFLIEIASAVGKESLESLLLTLDGARLEGEKVVLESAGSNDFSRRQIKDNLSAISDAAAKVVGSKVSVILGEKAARESMASPDSKPDPQMPPEGDLLEKVKREPVIKSFLDVFPGPVKAEKIET
jgi:DNA polymerase III gamma/tau subunit